MGPRALFVILSLAACGRGPEPGSAAAPAPDSGPIVGDAASPSTSGASGADATPSATAVDTTPARPQRRKLRLMEHEGPAVGPIHYVVVEPDDAHSRTPVIVALHGRGDTAEGFSRLVRRLELNARVIVAQAPLPYGVMGGRQWYDMAAGDAAAEVRARTTDLGKLLDQLAERYPEAGKPGLFGFSQGAVVAFEAALVMPERFAAIAPLSGYLANEGGGVQASSPPMLVVAGTKDGVIAQDRSWAGAGKLEALGRPVRRFGFQGAHSVPPAVVDELARFFDEHVPAPPR